MATDAARHLLLCALVVVMARPTDAQVDSTRINHPTRALKRAIVPGMGQLYNRQYLKIPIVYGGLAAFAGGAILVNQRYLLYRHAYLYTARTGNNGTPVFPQYETDYVRLLRHLGLRSEESLSEQEVAARRSRLEPQIRRQRDSLRRNRDLLYFGIVAWYGLSILDAYVTAHLLDFDVSGDLALSFGSRAGAITLRWVY